MANEDDRNGALVLLLFVALYAAYRIVEAIVAALLALLMGLVYIALGIAGVLAAFWVYRFITDKQFGETKTLQKIERLERLRKLHVSQLPKHLREQGSEYYIERQRKHLDTAPYSRWDVFLNRAKETISAFRKN